MSAHGVKPQAWQVSADRFLTLDRPRLIGILNVTPDSFFDGGVHATVDRAVEAALRMADEGADVIDIGGESTRPGAHPVAVDEQIRRTAPVIQGIRRAVAADRLLVSIDTTRSEVARAALDAGADIINDVSAGQDDPQMLAMATSRSCGLVLMHRRTTPQRDVFSDQYSAAPDYGGDVVSAVKNALHERVQAAIKAGVSRETLVIDPGLGFGKSVEQNYELVRRTGEIMRLGLPVLSASSRKSFIGAASGATEPADRLPGTLAVSLAHFLAGVRLFRVHDVAAHRHALAVAAKLAGESTE